MHRTKSIVAALAAIALSETAVFAAGGLKSPPSDHSWPDASRCRFREDRPGARGWPRRDRRGALARGDGDARGERDARGDGVARCRRDNRRDEPAPGQPRHGRLRGCAGSDAFRVRQPRRLRELDRPGEPRPREAVRHAAGHRARADAHADPDADAHALARPAGGGPPPRP